MKSGHLVSKWQGLLIYTTVKFLSRKCNRAELHIFIFHITTLCYPFEHFGGINSFLRLLQIGICKANLHLAEMEEHWLCYFLEKKIVNCLI